MQYVSENLLRELKADPSLFIEIAEFHSAYSESFEPETAVYRFASDETKIAGKAYGTRLLPDRRNIRRFLGSESNGLTISLNNADYYFSQLIHDNTFEGMWLVYRLQSRRFPEEFFTLFTGRCNKPSVANRERFTITARQDISIGDPEFPPRSIQLLCPLTEDFKGEACRGGVALSTKTTAYRTAGTCNGTRKQCVDYGNEVNFQGQFFRPISGTFTYTVEETKRFLFIFKKKKRRTVSAPYSSVSDFGEGEPIAEIAGTMQVQTQPVMHADTGTNIRTLNYIGNGEIDEIYEIRCRDKQYLPLLTNVHTEKGKYGSQGQGASTLFAGAGNFSGAAWFEGEVIGSDPADANDAAPTISCIVRGRKFETPNAAGNFDQKTWTDCGVYVTRDYLINIGGWPRALVNDAKTVENALITFEPVIDDTGVEQAVIPREFTGNVDFKAFASASGFGAKTIDKIALMLAQGKTVTGGYGQLVQAYYRYINAAQPPAFITPIRKVRRRYTTNYVMVEKSSLKEFITDTLLPSFNGRLIFGTDGKVYPYVHRPADSTVTVAQPLAGDEEILVENIIPWLRDGKDLILIGAHQESAEVNKVQSVRFGNLINPIAIAASGTGGVTVTGPTSLSVSTDTVPGKAVLTFAGSVAAGSTAEISIDGQIFRYVMEAGDDLGAVAGYLAAMINGHPRMKRYIRANWSSGDELKVTLIGKYGYLKLEKKLRFNHLDREEIVRIAAAYGGDSLYDEPIVEKSFESPLGERQSSINVVKGEYRSAVNDWAETPVTRSANQHIKQTRARVVEEINLSAVDNFHQAARLAKIRLGMLRLCDWFCRFEQSTTGILLDPGDVIAVADPSIAARGRYTVIMVEDCETGSNLRAEIIGRQYRTEIFDDTIDEASAQILLPLQVGTANNADPGQGGNGPTGTGRGDSGLGDDYREYKYLESNLA